ncbi:hypothetical protein ZIOFF_034857 [Zingiber officinale]|uniref:Uncharacterized protein n=1 Tax=Zingiber officinale TaxID=94328 RepID=A0A8J5GJ57_ZINOF|nr:hypothetical protein ZIOFF_034857 [Zingiber officinale]
MRPISASQSTESSKAFFSRPLRRLEKVTCRLARFSILLICVFPLTISTDKTPGGSAESYREQQNQRAPISPGHATIDKEGSDRKKEMRNRGYQIWDRERVEEGDF